MLKALMKKELLTLISGLITNRKTNKRRSAGGIIVISLLFVLIIVSLGFAVAGYSHVFVDTLVPSKS